jgi:hypothetical protein
MRFGEIMLAQVEYPYRPAFRLQDATQSMNRSRMLPGTLIA